MTSATGIQPPGWAGRRLKLARAVWFVTAILALIALLASIPAYVGSMGIFTETEHYAAAILASPSIFSPTPQFELWNDLAYDLLSFGAAGLSLGLAVLIFMRRPKEPVAFAVSLSLLLYGVVMAGPLEALVGQRPAGESLALFFQVWLWAFFIVLFFIFPDGRFVPGWTRQFSLLLIPWALVFGLWQSAQLYAAVLAPYLIAYTLPPLVACVAQFYRYRRVSNSIERQQTKWVILGFAAWAVGGTAVSALVILLVTRLMDTATAAWASSLMFAARLVWPLSLTFVPLALALAILRYHLWDIDVIIRRTLVYGLLTALMALVYFGVVVVLQAVLTALTGQQRSEVVTVISTLSIAALFNPLRSRVQGFVDNRFYRRKYDAARVLAQFGASVRHDVNLDQVTAGLLSVVDQTMQPTQANLWLRPGAASPSETAENNSRS